LSKIFSSYLLEFLFQWHCCSYVKSQANLLSNLGSLLKIYSRISDLLFSSR